MLIDPKGLIEWQALYGKTGAGLWRIGPSYKAMHFIFKSPCINNEKATVSVVAKGIGLSGGVSPAMSLGAGSATFYDNYSSINPNMFDSAFLYKGLSYLFAGSRTTTVYAGGASENMYTELGKGLHTDFISFENIRGTVSVKSIKMESCCEK